jgi:hypothetical protein
VKNGIYNFLMRLKLGICVLLGKNIFKKSKHQHSNKSFWMNYYFFLVKGDKK